MTENAEKPESNFKHIADIQKSVLLLLDHAIKKSNIDVKVDFLNIIVPLLRKSSEIMTNDEEIMLWHGYNELSRLIAPVTSESLSIAKYLTEDDLKLSADKSKKELRYIRNFFILFLLLFEATQIYSILLNEAVRDGDYISKEYHALEAYKLDNVSLLKIGGDADSEIIACQGKYDRDEDTASNASLPKSTIGVLNAEENIVKNIKYKENELHLKMQTANRMLCGLLPCWKIPFTDTLIPFPSFTKNFASENLTKVEKFFFMNKLAAWLLLILSDHILPFALGFLGAAAYLVRSSLSKLEQNSYTPSYVGRIPMRLFLGGLLGVISVMMLSPSKQELAFLKLSIVFIAFLMGYSVELSFTLFDRIIERIKKALWSHEEKAIATASINKTDREKQGLQGN